MRQGIAGTWPGNEYASRNACKGASRQGWADGWLRRFVPVLALAALTMAGLTATTTPSRANLFGGIYEDRAHLDALETASGQYNAGVSLLRTVQNFSAAAKWFRRAADKGHANAQAVLGSLYAVGLGVPKDFVNAYAWVSLALPRLEGRMRDRALALQDELKALMTPAQIGAAQKMAGDWHPVTN